MNHGIGCLLFELKVAAYKFFELGYGKHANVDVLEKLLVHTCSSLVLTIVKYNLAGECGVSRCCVRLCTFNGLTITEKCLEVVVTVHTFGCTVCLLRIERTNLDVVLYETSTILQLTVDNMVGHHTIQGVIGACKVVVVVLCCRLVILFTVPFVGKAYQAVGAVVETLDTILSKNLVGNCKDSVLDIVCIGNFCNVDTITFLPLALLFLAIDDTRFLHVV